MSVVEWHDELYSVGIVEIDDQHKGLFQLAEQLKCEVDEGRDEKILKFLFPEIYRHIAIHYRTEENYMEMCDYPDLMAHRTDHEKFVDAINAAYEKLGHDKGLLGLEILFVLNDWITNHIGQMDKKLTPYFKKLGI